MLILLLQSYSADIFSYIDLHIISLIYFLPYIVTYSDKDVIHKQNIYL